MLTTAEETRDFDRSLGELLLGQSKLDEAGLERAQRLAEGQGERLDRVLIKLGLVSERDMAGALAERLGLPVVAPEDYPEAPVLENEISINFLKSAAVIPLALREDELVLAMADPLDDYALKAMQLIAGRTVSPRVAIPAEIEAAVDRLYGAGPTSIGEIVETTGYDEGEVADEDVERLRDLASEAPVIRLVNLLIDRAVAARASDIHIEPFESKLRVRYRIDGVLREVEAPPNRFRAAVISRIKIMAKLNIAERRLPQDGRIKLATRGKEIDLRISVVPTMHGESLVMRILDRDAVVLDQPHGILLVTGPTGSGKTTTLYTSLLRLNTPGKKIFTVEDPIEYHLEGVNQVQVKPRIGLSFANVLRSILRQDPDIIMIGEIRDLETAQIAVQAALTGHVVLSTLHTNNAAGTISRLLDMGVEDYLLTSTVKGIAAQRLVRTLCQDCREPYRALPELIEQMQLGRFVSGPEPPTLYRAVGCPKCNGTGYLGRSAISEMLVMSDPMRQHVLRHAETGELHRAAVAEGMETMFGNGVRAALEGLTTLDEILRVTRDN
jgi:general secretion pathway protein E